MAIKDSESLSRFPQSGWEYRDMIDLGALVGECGYCGTEIRYCHILYHKSWGTISVGSLCADRLTKDKTASRREAEYKKYLERLQRYLESTRWKSRKNGHFFALEGYMIRIWDHGSYCNLEIGYPVGNPQGRYQKYEYIRSRHRYESLDAAKRKAFEAIVSGKFREYLKRSGIIP